jgi:hypothetical protein
METEEGEPRQLDRGNSWYFFVPLVLVGLWLLQGAAWLVVELIAPEAALRFDDLETGAPRSGISQLLELGQWFGSLAWGSLFIAYFVLLSRKRASGWWLLGGFCFCLNLPLYVALLFRQPRRFVKPIPAPPQPRSFGRDDTHPSESLLENSFACESCDALLNYGVSECYECGERYHYTDGKAQAGED